MSLHPNTLANIANVPAKRKYFLEDPIDYLVWQFEKTPVRKRPTVKSVREYCEAAYENLNKEVVHEKMKEENERRRQLKIKANNAVDPVKALASRRINLAKGLQSRIEQNKILKETDPTAYQEKMDAEWTPERREQSRQSMKNIPKESKSKNGHRLKEVLTAEDHKRMAKNSQITKRLKRDPIIKKIYNTIQTNDWFLISDIGPICENLGYNSHRNYRNLQNDIEASAFGKELFEVKVVNMKPSKKKFFRKNKTFHS